MTSGDRADMRNGDRKISVGDNQARAGRGVIGRGWVGGGSGDGATHIDCAEQ